MESIEIGDRRLNVSMLQMILSLSVKQIPRVC